MGRMKRNLVDMISRNMCEGKFLLLVVGDGIRESVEEMAAFIQRYTHMHYMLALVEMKIYKMPHDEKTWIVLPQVVTRTREIVRAIVKVQQLESAVVPMIRVDVHEDIERETNPITRTERDLPNSLCSSGKISWRPCGATMGTKESPLRRGSSRKRKSGAVSSSGKRAALWSSFRIRGKAATGDGLSRDIPPPELMERYDAVMDRVDELIRERLT